jgi:hypothetical protein
MDRTFSNRHQQHRVIATNTEVHAFLERLFFLGHEFKVIKDIVNLHYFSLEAHKRKVLVIARSMSLPNRHTTKQSGNRDVLLESDCFSRLPPKKSGGQVVGIAMTFPFFVRHMAKPSTRKMYVSNSPYNFDTSQKPVEIADISRSG